MSRLFLFFVIAIVLFSAAAGVSWYLQGSGQPAAKEPEEKTVKAEPVKGKPVLHEPVAPRPAPRGPVSPEAEKITAFASSLEKQQDALKGREQLVAQREKQLDLIHDEIKKDQGKLDAIRKDVENELALVQEKLDLLDKRTAQAEKERRNTTEQLEEVRKASLQLDSLETKNLKQLASIYDKMEAETAAQSILQLADKGKLDTAVTIISNMRERNAAALFNELFKQDATIGVQLFDRIRYLKTPTGAGKSEK